MPYIYNSDYKFKAERAHAPLRFISAGTATYLQPTDVLTSNCVYICHCSVSCLFISNCMLSV